MKDAIDHRWLASFQSVYQHNGFTAAAQKLLLPSSNVSRHVSLLERHLGVRLFERSTRRVVPTEAGTALYRRLAPITEALEEVLEDMSGHAQSIRGPLRILLPDLSIFAKVVTDFATQYPDVCLICETSLNPQESLQDGYDLILSFNRGYLADKNWVAKKMMAWESIVVASPSFIDKYGRPTELKNLKDFPCITTATALNGSPWVFQGTGECSAPITVKVESNFRINSGTMAYSAALAGIGLAILTKESCQQALTNGSLVDIKLDAKPLDLELHAYYSSRTLLPRKVRAFLDHLNYSLVDT